MTPFDITRWRLRAQHLAATRLDTPADVVRWLGAVQAQDYPGALWAVGLRMHAATSETIEEALARGTIVRTWPMRGTLHFVAPEDVRWMLNLLAPRILAGNARRLAGQFGIDEHVLATSREALTRALEGGRRLARPAVYRVLEAVQVSAAGQRGLHIVWWLAQEGLVCLGPRQGKQPAFVLLDEWVPTSRVLEREEALAELARRYFTGHGPATVQDFAWWSGLAVAEAREGLELGRGALDSDQVDGATYWLAPGLTPAPVVPPASHLLPAYDEFTVGYRERSAAVEEPDKARPGLGSLLLGPTLLIDDRIAGTWKRTLQKDRVTITAQPFRALDQAQSQALETAADRYGRFVGLPAVLG
jgi:hypothetical protein